MAESQSKKNLFLERDERASIPERDAFFYTMIDPIAGEEEREDDGDTGNGTVTLSVEQLEAYRQALFTKERRQRIDGQRKFGICPLSEDPNRFLGKQNSSSSCGFGESLKIHPLLARSQQFSGDDPSISANPVDNTEAIKQFPEKRLEHQLRLQKNLGLGASKSVTLVR